MRTVLKELMYKAIQIDKYEYLYLHPKEPLLLRTDVFSSKAVKRITFKQVKQILKEKGLWPKKQSIQRQGR